MDRKNVRSSNIRSIGYDPDRKILEVEFKSRNIYHYYGVPLNRFNDLMTASSHGKYLNRYIKGIYQYKKIR
ncbi:MAG: KTSC domain-containing protein [Candidatus Hodarchaeales archaeon]|jgi:hypothetical protein